MSLLRMVLLLSVAFGVAFTAGCPLYWTRRGGYCYRLIGSPKTWQRAEGVCQRYKSNSGKRADLVSIHSSSESTYIKNLLQTTYGIDNGLYWIGLTELSVNGHYTWSDNSLYSYQDWIPGEPNNAGGNPEHCVHIWKDKNKVGWNDERCDKEYKFICKMRK